MRRTTEASVKNTHIFSKLPHTCESPRRLPLHWGAWRGDEQPLRRVREEKGLPAHLIAGSP